MSISLDQLEWALVFANDQFHRQTSVDLTSFRMYQQIMLTLYGNIRATKWLEDIEFLTDEIKKRRDKLKKIEFILD